MKKLWHFVSKPQNLAVLVAVGTVVGFLWKEIVALRIAEKGSARPTIHQEATATGGTAINAAEGAQVAIRGDSNVHE